MELRDLQKMTVVKLRELALEQGTLTGVHGMDKRQIIEALAPSLGIDLEAASKATRTRLAADKPAIKREIRALKAQRDDALASGDSVAVAEARNGIKQRKRALRHIARETRTAAV